VGVNVAGLDGLSGVIVMLLVLAVQLLVVFWVIRLAVRAAIGDATKEIGEAVRLALADRAPAGSREPASAPTAVPRSRPAGERPEEEPKTP
jgi:hypothetical protein